MLADDNIVQRYGALRGLIIDSSILEVISFVEKYLVKFSKKYSGSRIINEKGLTQKLCNLLNFYAKNKYYPFWFDKEYMEEPANGSSPSIDIGVLSGLQGGICIDSKFYKNDESFFSLEAKRLFRISKKREKEYLIGHNEGEKHIDCGGVERFKKGIHGKNLKYGGMLGYLQERDFDYWYRTINSWTSDLIAKKIQSSEKWCIEDKLSFIYKKHRLARLSSKNSRNSDHIFLFHFWINLRKKK